MSVGISGDESISGSGSTNSSSVNTNYSQQQLQQQQQQRPLSQQVKHAEVPQWMRLFTAPTCCLIFGILLSPKFLVLALVYALVSARPLYYCLQLQQQQSRQTSNTKNYSNANANANTNATFDQQQQQQQERQVQEQLDAALDIHRSLTFQFAMMAACLWLYEHSRLLCTPSSKNNSNADPDAIVHQAFDMAKRLVQWEHAVGLAIEPSLQGFVWNYLPFLVTLSNAYYAVFHFVAPLGVMARLIVHRQDRNYELRAGFFIMLFLALILFGMVPTMPPRLMPSYKLEYLDAQQIPALSASDAQLLEPYWNIIDTMKQGETLYDKLHKEGGNPYAAMPSMHTGWALWSCLTWLKTIETGNASARSRKYQRLCAIGHVVSMVLVIMITGNHFWLDAAAGATCVLIGRVLAQKLVAFFTRDNGVVARVLLRCRHNQRVALVVTLVSTYLISGVDGSSSNYNKLRSDDGDGDVYDDLLKSDASFSRSTSSDTNFSRIEVV